MFIDSHAHLPDPLLKERAAEIIKNMPQDNLGKILLVGYDIKNSQDSIDMAQSHAGLFASVGVHPSSAHNFNDGIAAQILQLAKSKKVVAIGEAGLDYHYDEFNKEQQKKFFEAQIDIAHKLKLPLIVHLRDAEQDCRAILKANAGKLGAGVLFHCFCQSLDFMQFVMREIPTAYFAFGGATTFKKKDPKSKGNLTPLVEACPINRLLLETDCPYLTPEPMRGKFLNEPKFIVHIYEKVADIKNITVNELEKIAKENFKRLFKC